MRLGRILAVTAAVFAHVVSGIITGIAVPETIKAGEGFNLIIMTSNFPQSVYDVSVAVGIAPGSGFPDSLGQVLGSYYLGPEQSNVLYNITKWVPLPATIPMGRAKVSAAITSLLGAAAFPVVNTYNVSITVGTFTSNNYVSSLWG
ncbi:hypothetical protein L211DRAFT_837037 [Terfezia boudieri ATCC MYA-4762]|uniref:Secreted protein NIS1 n=1 Tax=Terfezia boudieri ATCC MYA-4762 TaxID=1051890 RepID=A0A3N4LPD4_9PEZI|nr:hypothetical protein L211DRAFT_837037 [Terfezia boudieri ATCC MYA-4762]